MEQLSILIPTDNKSIFRGLNNLSLVSPLTRLQVPSGDHKIFPALLKTQTQ